MLKWKCIHKKTTSPKKCIEFGHRDCLKAMCNEYNILDIEKIKINFDKNSLNNRYNNCDIDILSFMCELSDFDTVKFLIEEKNYNPDNHHFPLRGYKYLLASICYGNNFDIFLYFYNHALQNGIKFMSLTYPCIYGNIDILIYIYDNMTKKERAKNIPTNGLYHAICRNHIEIVKFLFDKYDLDLDHSYYKSFACCANLCMWKLLNEKKNITITKELISNAKKYNNDEKVYAFLNSIYSINS